MTRFLFAMIAVAATVAAYAEGFDLTPEEYERAEQADAEARAGVKRPLVVEVFRPTHAVVTGHGDDVAAFIEHYQTEIWPDWRDDDQAAAEVRARMAKARRDGRAVIKMNGKEARRAIATAIVKFDSDHLIIKKHRGER